MFRPSKAMFLDFLHAYLGWLTLSPHIASSRNMWSSGQGIIVSRYNSLGFDFHCDSCVDVLDRLSITCCLCLAPWHGSWWKNKMPQMEFAESYKWRKCCDREKHQLQGFTIEGFLPLPHYTPIPLYKTTPSSLLSCPKKHISLYLIYCKAFNI